ncbi:hypothetical protein [Nostoc sp. NIES-3756]|uniref:hypothetical protein n=1 Tax=Nostoc sp. NIES-3756 TaxID=1751286 RepID=UPI000AC5FE3B|nr:hypothetical protein [Nostoc sp. NIES-3756]
MTFKKAIAVFSPSLKVRQRKEVAQHWRLNPLYIRRLESATHFFLHGFSYFTLAI